jgi:hypothetical protein
VTPIEWQCLIIGAVLAALTLPRHPKVAAWRKRRLEQRILRGTHPARCQRHRTVCGIAGYQPGVPLDDHEWLTLVDILTDSGMEDELDLLTPDPDQPDGGTP